MGGSSPAACACRRAHFWGPTARAAAGFVSSARGVRMTRKTQNNSHFDLPVAVHRMNCMTDRDGQVAGAPRLTVSSVTNQQVLLRMRRGISCTELCRKVFRGQKNLVREVGPKISTPYRLRSEISPDSRSPSKLSNPWATSPAARAARSPLGCRANTSRRPMSRGLFLAN